ncbi:MAG: hypothetical protein BGO53_09000 [Sphingobacteriales bacterium 39-19]|nr:hypothetical protein [Sphingobacteriales bacterium]OJW09952.1 MAG: hypothetical protein BGO53_09000 [Sphingobacteriales bacterium 39-19]
MGKTSLLPPATTPLTGNELVEIEQKGAPKKVAVTELGGGGGGSMVYPGAGIPVSTGSAWGTSIPDGTDGKVLTMVSGAAAWADAPIGLPSMTGNSGKFLTTDGTVASWANLIAWGTSGNAGTDGGTSNFIGTTDNKDVLIKTNNKKIAWFTKEGGLVLNPTESSTLHYTYGGANAPLTIVATNNSTDNRVMSIGRAVVNTVEWWRIVGDNNFNTLSFQANNSGFKDVWRMNKSGYLTLGSSTPASLKDNDGTIRNATEGNFTSTGLFLYAPSGTEPKIEFWTPMSIQAMRARISSIDYPGISRAGILRFTVNAGGVGYSNIKEVLNLTPKSAVFGPYTDDNLSAAVVISSTTQGFLQPRMQLSEWTAISSKAEGLQGWNTTDHAQMWYDGTRNIGFRFNGTKFQGYDGTTWVDLN